MRKSWSRSLPPISPDYSGACSCLYELNPLIIIHDAAGCTGNYTGYDEPRWYDHPAPVFCSNLRELDAILGRDDRLIHGIEDCLDTIRPDLILICGSPVPAVIGTDFEGIAAEVEAKTKIPTIGLSTNGTHLYNWGYARCLEALVRRALRSDFVVNGIKEPAAADGQTVCLFGLSAIDGMDRAYVDWIKRGLRDAGITSICSVTMDCVTEELNQIAISDHIWCFCEAAEGSAAIAKYRNPNLTVFSGLPLTDEQRDGMIHELLTGVRSGRFKSETTLNDRKSKAVPKKKAVIVAEAYLAESIAAILNASGDWLVETIVLQEDISFSSSGRFEHVDSENELRDLLRRSDARIVIADPLLKPFVPAGVQFFDWPQFSLSSHLFGADERSVRDVAGQSLEMIQRID